jgi:hypothetical protein
MDAQGLLDVIEIELLKSQTNLNGYSLFLIPIFYG